MDSIKLQMVAVDQIYPLISDLVTAMGKVRRGGWTLGAEHCKLAACSHGPSNTTAPPAFFFTPILAMPRYPRCRRTFQGVKTSAAGRLSCTQCPLAMSWEEKRCGGPGACT